MTTSFRFASHLWSRRASSGEDIERQSTFTRSTQEETREKNISSKKKGKTMPRGRRGRLILIPCPCLPKRKQANLVRFITSIFSRTFGGHEEDMGQMATTQTGAGAAWRSGEELPGPPRPATQHPAPCLCLPPGVRSALWEPPGAQVSWFPGAALQCPAVPRPATPVDPIGPFGEERRGRLPTSLAGTLHLNVETMSARFGAERCSRTRPTLFGLSFPKIGCQGLVLTLCSNAQISER